MNTLSSAISNQMTETENGMPARVSTANACVDLFFKSGAMRGQNIVPAFTAAFVENSDYAVRIAQWLRDVRGGAGERQLFRDIMKHMELTVDPLTVYLMIGKIPEIGRWDDMLIFEPGSTYEEYAFSLIKEALNNWNGLCAKWMPRKGPIAIRLRNYLKLSPRHYRKLLVSLTKVVEQKMCSKEWDTIDFSSVPSVAASRYRRAFNRNTPETFAAYVEKLSNNNNDPSVKVNADAIFPHDVLKNLITHVHFADGNNDLDKTQLDFIRAQWDALPDYIEGGSGNIFPIIDVSGSMTCQVSPGLSALAVAVSLGLYVADKNKGPMKDMFMTFSERPELVQLKGNIVDKVVQTTNAYWGFNTDIELAIEKLLMTALEENVTPEEMPKMLLIFSDMQFDESVRQPSDTAMELIRNNYLAAGYELPKIVFWNIRDAGNVPVKFNEYGVALVSGYSSSILKSLLKGDIEAFSPETIMLETIMNDRYSL